MDDEHRTQQALAAITSALAAASPAVDDTGDPTEVLHALGLLRELRRSINTWEPRLIEAARRGGASWADLAEPLGVTSRQAAERRYLRVRPLSEHDSPAATGDERVKAERDRRAAQRTVATWARANAAVLRRLAGQITALPRPGPSRAATPTPADEQLLSLHAALGADDAALLLGPLAALRPHLRHAHPELAVRIDDIIRHTDRLRRESLNQRAANGG